MRNISRILLAAYSLVFTSGLFAAEFADSVEHKFADSDGVKIHYAKAGSGPLAVFIHGFPDFWYSWRHQMEGLASSRAHTRTHLRLTKFTAASAGERAMVTHRCRKTPVWAGKAAASRPCAV